MKISLSKIFWGMGRVGLDKPEASRGRRALSLISKLASEFKNKENFMSDIN